MIVLHMNKKINYCYVGKTIIKHHKTIMCGFLKYYDCFTHILVDFPFEFPAYFFRASQTSPGSKVSGQLETS